MVRGFGVLGYGMRGGHFWLGPVVGGIFWLLVIAALVLFVVWLSRGWHWRRHAYAHAMRDWAGGGSVAPPTQSNGTAEAVAIAKRRLASGEITSEQYQEIVRTLGS